MNTPPITPSSSAEVIQFQPKPHKSKHFLVLGHDLLQSSAYQSCSAVARAVFIEIARRHNGHNNGRIHFSGRDAAAALKIGLRKANRGLQELQAVGLIICTRRGSFDLKTRDAKLAPEWFVPSLGTPQHPVGDTTASRKPVPGDTTASLIDKSPKDKIDARTRTPEEERKFKDAAALEWARMSPDERTGARRRVAEMARRWRQPVATNGSGEP